MESKAKSTIAWGKALPLAMRIISSSSWFVLAVVAAVNPEQEFAQIIEVIAFSLAGFFMYQKYPFDD